MEYTLFAILTIFSIIVVIEFTKIITRYFLANKKETDIITVLPISGRIEDVEYLIRQLMWKSNWEKSSQKLILLDLGADDETVGICKNLCKDNLSLKFFTPRELEEFLGSYSAK